MLSIFKEVERRTSENNKAIARENILLVERMETIKKEMESLNEKVKYYKQLYVDKSKGKFYEELLFKKIVKYNDK